MYQGQIVLWVVHFLGFRAVIALLHMASVGDQDGGTGATQVAKSESLRNCLVLPALTRNLAAGSGSWWSGHWALGENVTATRRHLVWVVPPLKLSLNLESDSLYGGNDVRDFNELEVKVYRLAPPFLSVP